MVRPRFIVGSLLGGPGVTLDVFWALSGSFLQPQARRGVTLRSPLNILFDSVAMCMFLFVFPCVFSPWSVVEAAPQARPKTTSNARSVVEVCSARSFYVLELLGPFAMVLGFGLTMSPQRFSFKRASRPHAKPGLSAVASTS